MLAILQHLSARKTTILRFAITTSGDVRRGEVEFNKDGDLLYATGGRIETLARQGWINGAGTVAILDEARSLSLGAAGMQLALRGVPKILMTADPSLDGLARTLGAPIVGDGARGKSEVGFAGTWSCMRQAPSGGHGFRARLPVRTSHGMFSPQRQPYSRSPRKVSCLHQPRSFTEAYNIRVCLKSIKDQRALCSKLQGHKRL